MATSKMFHARNQTEYDDMMTRLDALDDKPVNIYLSNVDINVAELFNKLPSSFMLYVISNCRFVGGAAALRWTTDEPRTVNVDDVRVVQDVVSFLRRLPESNNYKLHLGNINSDDAHVLSAVPRSCVLSVQTDTPVFDVSAMRNVRAVSVNLLAYRNVTFTNPPYKFENLRFMEIRASVADATLGRFVSTLVCDETLYVWFTFYDNQRSDELGQAYWNSTSNLILDSAAPTILKYQLNEITIKKRVLTLYHRPKNPKSEFRKFIIADGDNAIMTRVLGMLIGRPRTSRVSLPSFSTPPYEYIFRAASSFHRARFVY